MESSFEETELSPDTPLGDVFVDKFKNNALHLMRQNVAMQSPLGKNSAFYENRCGEFGSFPVLDALNANKLIEHLSYNLKNESYFFDGLELINSYSIKSPSNLTPKSEYEYHTLVGESRKTLCLVRINRRICTLDPDLTFSINNVIPGYDPWFTISISYSGTKQFRREALETGNVADFELSMKYKAAMLSFTNAESFIYAFAQLDPSKTVVPNVTEHFDQVYSKYKSVTERKWYHEHAPIMPNAKIDNQMYWDDLYKLLLYDKDGTFSWFKDSSNAILNIVRKISLSQNGMTFLYDQFNQDNTCYEIYEHMSGSSEFNGETRENKTVFTSLIMAICEANAPNILRNTPFVAHERDRTDITFKMTKGFRVDSNSAWDDDYHGKFNLYQEEAIPIQISETAYPVGGSTGRTYLYDSFEWVVLNGKTHYLHPLDMVMVELYDENGNTIQVALPAIYVKDIAYHEEWERNMMAIRIAVDILMFIIPFGGVIRAVKMFFKVVLVVNSVVAGIDIFTIAFRSQILRWDGGKEFLEAWDSFYHLVGLATGIIYTPQLLFGISRVLITAGKMIYQTSIQSMIAMGYGSIIEVKNSLGFAMRYSPNYSILVAKKFEILLDFTKLKKYAYSYKKINKLRAEGAILGEGVSLEKGKEVKLHILTYEQSILAEGKTLRELEKKLARFFDAKGVLLVEELRGMDLWILDISKALKHVKYRDLNNLARRDVVGLHDAQEFFKLRITKSLGNRNFKFPKGKKLDEVDEIVILSENEHPFIPGVKTIEYRVPASDGKFTQKINGIDVNKGYTTGEMTGNGLKDFVKNIYDPAIWTDNKLEKALIESIQDAFRNKPLIDGQFNGLTLEGYSIQGYIRNGKIETFYFY